MWVWSIATREATKLLLDRLNQIATAYDALFYVLAALLFLRSYSRANTPLLRQQLKWVTRGTLLAVLPFTLFYAVPYLLHLNPPHLLTNLAGLSLVFLPLTFSWAIVRYRLMDTDLIFKRGVAYTLATALHSRRLLRHHRPHLRLWSTTPCRKRCASGDSFLPFWSRPRSSIPSSAAFRAGSIAPSIAIATTTAGPSSSSAAASAPKPISQALLNSIVEQLPRTLLVARVAIFLAEDSGRLRLAASHGLPEDIEHERQKVDRLDLGFLNFDHANGSLSHLP